MEQPDRNDFPRCHLTVPPLRHLDGRDRPDHDNCGVAGEGLSALTPHAFALAPHADFLSNPTFVILGLGPRTQARPEGANAARTGRRSAQEHHISFGSLFTRCRQPHEA